MSLHIRYDYTSYYEMHLHHCILEFRAPVNTHVFVK